MDACEPDLTSITGLGPAPTSTAPPRHPPTAERTTRVDAVLDNFDLYLSAFG